MDSASQFYMFYMCVFMFVKSVLCSSNNSLSRLANLYVRCSDFGHQLALMNVQMDVQTDVPIYLVSQFAHFIVICSA